MLDEVVCNVLFVEKIQKIMEINLNFHTKNVAQ